MFWVTDNFLMKKPKRSGRNKRAVRYQRVGGGRGSTTNNNSSGLLGNSPDDSDALLSGDEDMLDDTTTTNGLSAEESTSNSSATTALAFKNIDELLNVNRRTNSVVWYLKKKNKKSVLNIPPGIKSFLIILPCISLCLWLCKTRKMNNNNNICI